MRLTRMIVSQLLRRPFRDVLTDDQRTWKAWQLYLGALHLARIIERTTDRPHVGFMLPTSGLAPMSILATWLLGRTTVPINYLLGESDREYLINDAEIDTVITVRAMIDNFGALPEGVKPIFLEDLKEQAGPIPPLRRAARRDDDHLAVLLYTSGTSGRPKGVMLSAGNITSNIEQAETLVGFRQHQHKLFGVIPQFHSFGLTVLTLLPLALGVPVVFTARFMPRRILELLAKEKPTVLVLIPSMYNALLSQKSAKREQFDSLKLIVSGGEPLPHAVAEGYQERFGITINEGYGLTETSPATNICMPGAYKAGSVGPALDRLETRIVGENEQLMPTGEEGEIRFRGPNVMKGYYKLPDETAAVFDDDGFFRTGDMGKLDEDGYLYITGRIKEMLIVGGENVFPRSIEEVLNRHPSVHASAVIGMKDDIRGELPLAFVELEEDATFNENELRSLCRDELAPYKVPRDIRWIEKLPRNPTGKVLRRELSVDVTCRSLAGAEASSAQESDT